MGWINTSLLGEHTQKPWRGCLHFSGYAVSIALGAAMAAPLTAEAAGNGLGLAARG